MLGCIGNTGGNSGGKGTLVVTILPLKYLVNEITDSDFEVKALVPPGASLETYEPTPQQIVDVEQSQALFTTGLIDFENMLVDNLKSGAGQKVQPLSTGIELLKNDCGHHHGKPDDLTGVDPHIWMSPKELIVVSRNIYRSIALLYPDSSRYYTNYQNLIGKLERLDAQISEQIAHSGVRSFIIYHPALTYYAHRYGLEQIAIEQEGKEPSATHIRDIIDRAKRLNIRHIIYQRQLNEATVKTIAADINADIITIDQLQENIIDNLIHITDIITNK
jgi:zinc transport system substrate-binding protein